MLSRAFSLLLLIPLSLARTDDNRLVAVENFIETITVAEGDSTVTFFHRFVIEGSVLVVSDSISLPGFRLDSVNGMLILEETLQQKGIVTVSYDYLKGNIPIAVEPAVSRLPLLGMTPIGSAKTFTTSNVETFSRLPVVADGAIFRSINISPNSGATMNGGLQLNLQGKLSEQMTINGVLSDQNTPIQPEGDTRSISEIDKVFIGSCTNGRIEDLREVAKIVEGHKVSISVDAMIVPGSGLVKEQAEKEGLDKILIEAGFDWREPGCSMCLAMNPDQLMPKERCASTSNRNFEGRQGREGLSLIHI